MAITKSKLNIVMKEDLKDLIAAKAEALGYGEREISRFVRGVLKNITIQDLRRILKEEDRISA